MISSIVRRQPRHRFLAGSIVQSFVHGEGSAGMRLMVAWSLIVFKRETAGPRLDRVLPRSDYGFMTMRTVVALGRSHGFEMRQSVKEQSPVVWTL